MMINLGIGMKKIPEPRQNTTNGQAEGDVDMTEIGDGDLLDKVERHINSAEGPEGAAINGNARLETDEEQNSDISVLNTIIEEMYDRFNEAEINKILRICGEVLSGKDTQDDGMHLDGPNG
jgi:hypothetical protein